MDELTVQVILLVVIVAALVFGGILFLGEIGKWLNRA